MGERKGQNKYYPPDFDPRKHKSLDAYHGSHPLRERAKKIHLGILTIRFEMPYNIWCDGCGNHIGMGVRYNAEKSKIGNYYSTPIYKFRMKCHLCPSYIEIKTDPAAHDYVIISGARRKEQRWDPKENEQIVTDDKAMQKKLVTDAMFRLEHTAEDQAKIKMAKPAIGQLTEMRETMKDDYLLNKLARSNFRAEKKSIKVIEDSDNALLKKSSLDIELVNEHSDDIRMAHLMKYTTVASFDEKQKKKREEIEKRSIFRLPVSSSEQSEGRTLSKAHQLATRIGIDRKKLSQKSNTIASPGFGSTIVRKKSNGFENVIINSRNSTETSHKSPNSEKDYANLGLEDTDITKASTFVTDLDSYKPESILPVEDNYDNTPYAIILSDTSKDRPEVQEHVTNNNQSHGTISDSVKQKELDSKASALSYLSLDYGSENSGDDSN